MLPRRDTIKIAAAAGVDPRTVDKVYRGKRLRMEALERSVREAAADLGYPPAPVTVVVAPARRHSEARTNA